MKAVMAVLVGASMLLAGGCVSIQGRRAPEAEAGVEHVHDCSVRIMGIQVCRGCTLCRLATTDPELAGDAWADDQNRTFVLPSVIPTRAEEHTVWHVRTVGPVPRLVERPAPLARPRPELDVVSGEVAATDLGSW